ncbi:MAG TPA: hypothetical protein VMG09_02515 [Bacteroidota bacterium]|nr:hypothetical protein [Bacteroidota bacterium]
MKSLVRALCVLALAGASAMAQAPANGQGQGQVQGEKPIERLERLRNLRMVEMLDLKEDQSVRFFARLKEHDQARHELRKQRNDILDQVERLVRNHAADAEYEAPFAQIAAIDQKLSEENRSFFAGLGDILTTEQRGKLLLFERRFESELRDAIREARLRRAGQ